jgi:CspA family cold shock protein
VKGKVKWFNQQKGFGFITGEDGKDAFLHISDLGASDVPKDRQAVEFQVKTTDKGLRVSSVRLLSILLVLAVLLLGGCLSALHRADFDKFTAEGGSHTGNGRSTTLSTSQPAPVAEPIRQREPAIGEVIIVVIRGTKYEAVRKTDGRLYIIQEVK